MTREAGEKFLALAGKNLDELLKASERADFKPIELGIQVRGHMPSKIRHAGHAQRRRDDSGQRPQIEGRVHHLQRALGPSGDRHAGERRCHL